MDITLVILVIFACVYVCMYVYSNDDVIKLVDKYPFYLIIHGIIGVTYIIMAIYMIMKNHYLYGVCDTIISAMCIRIIYSWWRRRKQKKPNRILGVVKNLGHKLTVVNVPAFSGN